ASVADVLRRRSDADDADALVDLAVLSAGAIAVFRAASPAVAGAVLRRRRVREARVLAGATRRRAALFVVRALRQAHAALEALNANARRARIVRAVAEVELRVADGRARVDDANRRRVVRLRRPHAARALRLVR